MVVCTNTALFGLTTEVFGGKYSVIWVNTVVFLVNTVVFGAKKSGIWGNYSGILFKYSG